MNSHMLSAKIVSADPVPVGGGSVWIRRGLRSCDIGGECTALSFKDSLRSRQTSSGGRSRAST
jgi:hypothetical protein